MQMNRAVAEIGHRRHTTATAYGWHCFDSFVGQTVRHMVDT